VPQCSHPPHWSCHQRRLANCDWMLASYNSRQSSYPCWASSLLRFVGKEPHYSDCIEHAVSWNLCICSTQRSPVHPGADPGLGVIAPHKTYESNFIHHDFVQFGKQYSRRDCTGVLLNRLRTGVWRFRSCLHKWGMAPFALCECGAVHRPPHGGEWGSPSTSSCECGAVHRPPHDWTAWRFWMTRPSNGCQHLPPDLVRPSSELKELLIRWKHQNQGV